MTRLLVFRVMVEGERERGGATLRRRRGATAGGIKSWSCAVSAFG